LPGKPVGQAAILYVKGEYIEGEDFAWRLITPEGEERSVRGEIR